MLVVVTFMRHRDARLLLGVILVLLLVFGAFASFLMFSRYEQLPDPFHVSPVAMGSDVMCGTPLNPGRDSDGKGGMVVENDAGCDEWRADRTLEGVLWLVLAAGAVTATAVYAGRSQRDC